MKVFYYFILFGFTIIIFTSGVALVNDISNHGLNVNNMFASFVISLVYIIGRWGLDEMKEITFNREKAS